MEHKATARVRVELDVFLSDTWGKDCTVEQIMKQAKDSACGYVEKTIRDKPRIERVGPVRVTAIFVEEDR